MTPQIETIDDVIIFIKQVAGEISDFHPMNDFTTYVEPGTQQPRYTQEEAGARNKLLDRSVIVLAAQDVDFCTFLFDVFEMASDQLAQTQAR